MYPNFLEHSLRSPAHYVFADKNSLLSLLVVLHDTNGPKEQCNFFLSGICRQTLNKHLIVRHQTEPSLQPHLPSCITSAPTL